MTLKLPPIAISVQQPWAWLIVNGYKDIENRDWPTKFRGPVAIHAGKKIDREAFEWIESEHGIALPTSLDVGGIVGVASITDCVREHSSKWFVGDYGFVLTDRRPVDVVPCRGQLGFFRWRAVAEAAR